MPAYKAQLRRNLVEHGWEVVEVIDSDNWWADEYWRIHSRRNYGYEIFLTFLVDPLWDAPRKKGTGVWAVSATESIPGDRLAAENSIVELCMRKGRFDEKLEAFVASLDLHRNNREIVMSEPEERRESRLDSSNSPLYIFEDGDDNPPDLYNPPLGPRNEPPAPDEPPPGQPP